MPTLVLPCEKSTVKPLSSGFPVQGITEINSILSAGYLSIMTADTPSEREVMEAESPGTASDLNRSDLDPIYIGGLPASRPIR